ncbi:unnamed protein product [Tilletia laevis]|uniref:Histone-lysine N-methyltransferase, H3 lysine-4 specific n=2 Tax=Tilletia TaxID=13289 RepID=A0A177V7V3_9BASI|nr:hypothetical protein CF336_g996 [Tilletia laevis]KAE8265745.1 hypothetical protein A4X03_0g53 [Tilletia caries]CAD6977635.1 unnamed protein product [Tilletia controversa]KAE8208216.1 hypothetical protein CF335_g587 [Tilletia laevis]CAD6892510.1 unnamed protein product [Tilletia caries]
MTAKAHISDELRSVVQTINAERLKDSEWEAAFDRHLKTNRNKRVAPISRRVHLGPLDTASEEVPHTPAAPSASNAAAAPAIPPTTPQDVAALLLPPEPKKIPTGPSLLQRLGTLSSVSPAKKTIVERAGLPLDTRLAPPPPPPRSQDEPNGGGGGSSSSSSSRHVHRPRDVWEAPPRGSSSRSQDAPGGGGGDGGSSSSRHVHRPRDTWEAPPRADRRDRDREARDPTRCDTYFPPSSPFVSDPMLSHSQSSSSSRLPPRPSLSSSLEDDRESVSSSHYYSSHHRRTPTYGGPLPSPPPQQLSGLAPPPPARPSMEANGCLLLAPFSLSSEQSADHPYPTPKLEPPPPVVEEQEDLFPLPHELPFDPEDRNYIAWPPPSVAAASGGGEGKGGSKEREAAVRFAPRPGSAAADALETAPVIKDPRLKLVAEGRYGLRGRRKLVTQLNIFKWERDAHSAGPLPPMAVAVGWQDNTWHFSEILKFFQPFGRIEATEAELDKDIGTRMPFLWIKFAHDYDARGHIKPNLNPGRAPQDAIKIVPKVVKELDGFRLPGKVEVRMSVRADAERRRYRAAYEAELQRRRAERAGPSAASDSTKSVAAQTPMRSAVGHAGASPSRSRIDGGATATSRSPMSTRDEHVHAHAHGSNGRYAAEGSARRTSSFSRPQADPTAAAAAAAAESHLRNGNGSAAQAGPDRPARWLMNGHGAAADPYASREFAGIPKAPKTTRWSDASSHEVEGRKTGKAALPPPPPSLPPRVGRLGGIAPGGPVNTTTNLSTEEIHRRLSILGRSYFRWPKGPRKLKFSEIKGLFHGNANIDLLEQDEAYFYCCLKSELLTMQHHRTPVRSLRGMDCITLQLCPPLDPRAYGGSHETGHGYGHGIGNGPNGVGVGNTASQQQQMAMRHLTDALVNSAKHHADQQQQQQMENHLLRHSSHHHHHHQVTAAAPAVVDAMAVLANSTSSIPSAPASTRGMPLPSIRRREHIPEEEVREDEEYVSRPSKIRKVSGGGGRTREGAREYHQEYRGSSLEPHGRGGAGGGAVKGSSPSLPLAQATPTESTRMGDSDEDDDDGVGGGIKDDDTQTTEEMVEERSSAAGEDEKKRNAGGGAGPIHARGVKRALRQIFSSDEEEEDGGSAEEGDDDDASSDSADDEDDDVSSVEKTLLSFKASPPPRKKKQQQPQQQQRQQQLPVEVDTEEDDALASMLLETVASIEPVQVHDVALQDLLESVGSKGMPHSARKPAKATAKANKKAKIAATVAAKKPKGKPPTKSSRPEPIRTVPAPAPEPEVAIVVRQPEESYTPTESIPPTPTEANAAGPKALPRKADPRTKKGRRERARSPSPDPFALSLAENEEDLYFLRLACERLRDGLGVAEEEVPEGEDGVIPAHSSGAARTEGYYKIPASQKAAHLPDRNKAIVEETTGAALRQVGTARGNRAESRRVLMNIELHKKESATDTDMLKFNQLSARKKQLRFAKSPIHDWGLYAMEQIPAGDMVIEYVGEVIRQQVADEREKRYERQGQFSTYLFRVDDELVVDATMKGNIARLMNHCCTPNCTAKILTVNGEKRIALFAKSTILPGQELTYDYKFQSTGDDADQISCLCGSPQCRKFL